MAKSLLQEPIAALATAGGVGAIAIIRISGEGVIGITDTFFKKKHQSTSLQESEGYTLHLGHLYNGTQVIDEVLVSIFKAPRSYTGEEVVEISCHGSSFIQNQILQLLNKNGIRNAEPGEFTLRAFMNNKMDLTQAEAVADLISSESAEAHNLAIQQMRGGFSDKLQLMRQELIDFAALLELELDFSEEDVEFANREKFMALIADIQDHLKLLIDSFSYGNAIKEGISVAIAGKPNAGKSSLLNALLNEDKAIVSDIAGTTRDSIEDTLVIQGVQFRFIDTAGLRNTTDTIEAIGVKKAVEKVHNARILLYLFDRNDTTFEEIEKDIQKFSREDLQILLVENKIDVQGGFFENELTKQISNQLFSSNCKELIAISTNDPNSIKRLKASLIQIVEDIAPNNDTVVTNARHWEALQKSLEAIQQVKQGMQIGISGDLLAQDLRICLAHIGEITGEIDIDSDILGTIFGRFCIGK